MLFILAFERWMVIVAAKVVCYRAAIIEAAALRRVNGNEDTALDTLRRTHSERLRNRHC